MKKVLSLLLVTALVLSFTAVSVFAADTITRAELELTEGKLEIVDPITPDPDLPGVITGIGMDMNFGKRQVAVTEKTYSAIKAGITGDDQDLDANFQPIALIVSDARGSATSEWHVKVKVSEFAGSKLPGFELKLAHLPGSVVGTGSAAQKPTPVAAVTLAGGALTGTNIFDSAAVGGSAGKWGGNWQPSLVVKAGTGTVALHTATVNWSVGVTP